MQRALGFIATLLLAAVLLLALYHFRDPLFGTGAPPESARAPAEAPGTTAPEETTPTPQEEAIPTRREEVGPAPREGAAALKSEERAAPRSPTQPGATTIPAAPGGPEEAAEEPRERAPRTAQGAGEKPRRAEPPVASAAGQREPGEPEAPGAAAERREPGEPEAPGAAAERREPGEPEAPGAGATPGRSASGTGRAARARLRPGDETARRAGEPPFEREGPLTEPLVEEALAFVRTLVGAPTEPLRVDRADHFVRPEQTITLITDEQIEEMTPAEMRSDPALEEDTPITVVKTVEQIEIATPEKIIADAGGELDKPIRVLREGAIHETTVGEILEQQREHPDEPIKVVKEMRYFEKTTPGELAKEEDLDDDRPLKVIRTPYALTAATVAELLGGERDVAADSIFYVRTVRPGDDQGIWGIIHHGLIDNFAQGMAIRRGKALHTYRVEIPRDADERLPDNSSSFLGRFIYEKMKRTAAYNFRLGRIRQNPDALKPGQEIVIVSFTPDELVAIYRHFVARRG